LRLELYIRGHLLDEEEFILPPFERCLSFEENVKHRELCVNRMKELLKKNNERIIEEKEWEIRLIAESKICEIEEEIFKPELN